MGEQIVSIKEHGLIMNPYTEGHTNGHIGDEHRGAAITEKGQSDADDRKDVKAHADIQDALESDHGEDPHTNKGA